MTAYNQHCEELALSIYIKILIVPTKHIIPSNKHLKRQLVNELFALSSLHSALVLAYLSQNKNKLFSFTCLR